MITKERLKQTIELVQELQGELNLIYTPSKVLDSVKDVYNLYYSNRKITIGSGYYNRGNEYIKFTNNNIDEIVDKIYDVIKDDISDYIMKSLENLELSIEYLKYFDRELELFKKFKDEVLKLKNENLF